MTRTPESLARARFFAIGSMRILGAIFMLAGFALIRGGLAVVLFGVFDFAVMPKILARRWRTPRTP